VRNQTAIGGGALYDIGCYAIVAGRFVFEADPQRAIALIDRDLTFGTDRTTSGILDFGDGRQLAFTVSTQSAPYQRVQIVGTRGRIEIQIPFNAPQGEATRILVDDGSSLDGRSIKTETLPACDQYMLEGEAFSRAIRSEIPLPYGLDDAIANMAVIDALFRSETSRQFELVTVV
jgi:predicted dehydrogenase